MAVLRRSARPLAQRLQTRLGTRRAPWPATFPSAAAMREDQKRSGPMAPQSRAGRMGGRRACAAIPFNAKPCPRPS